MRRLISAADGVIGAHWANVGQRQNRTAVVESVNQLLDAFEAEGLERVAKGFIPDQLRCQWLAGIVEIVPELRNRAGKSVLLRMVISTATWDGYPNRHTNNVEKQRPVVDRFRPSSLGDDDAEIVVDLRTYKIGSDRVIYVVGSLSDSVIDVSNVLTDVVRRYETKATEQFPERKVEVIVDAPRSGRPRYLRLETMADGKLDLLPVDTVVLVRETKDATLAVSAPWQAYMSKNLSQLEPGTELAS